MSCNFAAVADEYVISKKFRFYFKTTSNSNRIPKTVFFIETHGANDQEKADLFNSYFYEQFVAPVNYEIGIDYSRDFEIEFDENSVQQLLKHIDPNKAPGPDQIHGKVLKYCSKSSAKPLAILFRLSYNSCKIPLY
jgi:hypothetical protein